MKLNYKGLSVTFLTLLMSMSLISQNLSSELHLKKSLKHYTVFAKGEDGYHTYRIPAIVQAKNGTLIAMAEARRDNSGDPGNGHIDLVYKLSHDGGKSWSALRILSKSDEGWGASNPTAVVDKSNGRILVLYDGWKPGRGGNRSHYSQPGTLDNQLWIRHSDDNGNTWTEAKDITSQGRDLSWSNAVFGPGHGIQTKTGRLVIPVNAPGKFSDDPYKTASYGLYSDDGGNTWRRGNHIDAYTTENQIAELDNGQLMINARQKENNNTRWVALSDDQGQKWNEPRPGQICAQICCGLIRYPQKAGASLLLWTGIRGPGRTNLVVQLSSDQGLSFPAELLIGEGPSAYSDVTLMNKGVVGVLWESGKENPYETIKFTPVPGNVIKMLNQKANPVK